MVHDIFKIYRQLQNTLYKTGQKPGILFSFRPQYAELVDQYKCTSKQQLEDDLKKMIKLGAEGLMIRQPGSVYERCRSKTLLKLKKFYDAEVLLLSDSLMLKIYFYHEGGCT